MKRQALPLIAILCALAAIACGGAVPAATTGPATTPDGAATQTRAIEVSQLATLGASAATSNAVATQTRAAEVAQLATLAAPTATTSPPRSPIVSSAVPRSVPPTATAGTSLAKATSFVGRADGSEAFVAVVVDDSRATAYVCDGATMAAWLSGPVREGNVELSNDEGQRLTISLGRAAGGAGATPLPGNLRAADGKQLTFSVARAADNGRAGLYRAEVGTAPPGGDEAPRVGVIVLDSGEFRGAYWADEKATPVTDVRLGAGSLDTIIPGIGTITTPRLGAPLGGHTSPTTAATPLAGWPPAPRRSKPREYLPALAA